MLRTFLDWSRPALPAVADVLLGHHADGLSCRMDAALVVVPGARAGRRLKELLEERARTGAIALVPPRIITVGALPEILVAPGAMVATGEAARLAWIAALRDTPGLDRVFVRRPEDGALAEWSSLAAELERLHRDVAQGGFRFAGVTDVLASAAVPDGNDADRWRVLADVQERYEALLAGCGLADRDLERIRALGDGRAGTPSDVWLVGVAEMPMVTRRLLEAVRDRVHVLVHAPEAIADRFDAFGCVLPESWSSADLPLPETALRVVDKPGDQADAVAGFLGDAASDRAPDDVAVAVSSPDVIPWIAERLSAVGVSVRDASGVDPVRTAPFRLLLAVADALDADRWEPMAALARHPDVGEWLAGNGHDADDLLARADRWYVQHLPDRLPDNLRGVGRSTGDGEAANTLASALRSGLLEPLRSAGSRTLREWVEPLLVLLAEVYSGRTWRAGLPSHRVAIQALEQLGEGIRAFSRVPRTLDPPCSAAVAIRLIVERAARRAIPNPQDRNAVELLGWLELHMDDAPIAVLVGANEPWLPESVAHDAFLPNGLRARLGLSDNRSRYARDAYRLSAVAMSTEAFLVVSGRWDADGNPLRPSRLLFAADGATVARRVRRFYDAEFAAPDGDGVPESLPPGPATDPPGGRAIALPPEPMLRFRPPEVLSVTQFRSILQDPYGWALSTGRGCEPIDDHAREMDGGLFGTLMHAVLESLGAEPESSSTDVEALQRHLDRKLDDEVAVRFGKGARDARVAVRLQVEQARARLHRVAEWHAGRIRAGWRVVATEARTPEEGVPLEVDGTRFPIKGRVDRVEFHAGTGEWALFDYKTGDKAKDPDKEHRAADGDWIDLQLPLYRWLLPSLEHRDGRRLAAGSEAGRVRLGYVPIPARPAEVREVFVEWDEAILEEAMEVAKEAVRWVRKGIAGFDTERVPNHVDPRLGALLGLGLLGSVPEEAEEE